MENYHILFTYDFQYFKKNLKTFYFIHLPVIVFIVLLVLISHNPFRMSSHICNLVIKLLLLHRDVIISNFGALILSSHFLLISAHVLWEWRWVCWPFADDHLVWGNSRPHPGWSLWNFYFLAPLISQGYLGHSVTAMQINF